jgi:hypothetical protein
MVTLSDSNTLHDFGDFLVDFDYHLQICVHCLDGSNKFGGGTIFDEDFQQQIVICRVVRFNKVNKCNK